MARLRTGDARMAEMNADRAARLASLTTAHLADACIRVDVPVRCAPAGMRPLAAGSRVAGRVLPARHAGSVDVFLEAFEHAREGDVLVVDNGGRTDQACIGDLVVVEARAAGVAEFAQTPALSSPWGDGLPGPRFRAVSRSE